MGFGSNAARYLTQGGEDYYTYSEIEPETCFYDPSGIFGDSLHNFTVSTESFSNLCAGRHYATRDPLTGAVDEKHRAGYDFTFSAPKSYSIIHALSSENTRRQLSALHLAATKQAVDFLSEHAAYTRFRQGGEVCFERAPLLCMMFPHHESRAGDPQEHIHVTVMNMTKNRVGGYGNIDSRALLLWRGAAAARYHVDFAWRLSESFNIRCQKDARNFRCEGVPEALIDLFSKRRKSIEGVANELKRYLQSRDRNIAVPLSHDAEQVLAQLPNLTAAQCAITQRNNRHIANIISKLTRDRKATTPYQDYLTRWREATIAQCGSLDFIDDLVVQSLSVSKQDTIEGSVRQAVLEKTLLQLTEERSRFTEATLHQLLAENAIGLLSLGAVDDLLKKIVASGDLVVMPRCDNGLRQFTTVEQIRLELAIQDFVQQQSVNTRHQLSLPDLAKACQDYENEMRCQVPGFVLDDEQKASIVQVGHMDAAISAYEGLAGTGKSSIARVLANAYTAQGYRMMGVAFSTDAADNLAKASGITAISLDGLITKSYIQAQLGRKNPLDERTILLVDESSMNGARKTHSLFCALQGTGAKVIFTGDNEQGLSMSAGQTFPYIAKHCHAMKMRSIRRQRLDDRDPFGEKNWRIDVVKKSLAGDMPAVLSALDKRDHLHVKLTAHEAQLALVDRWYGSHQAGRTGLILASRNQDVQDIALLARGRLLAEGVLDNSQAITLSTKRGEQSFAIGEKIRCTQNNIDLKLKNGLSLTIKRFDRNNSTAPVLYCCDDAGRDYVVDTAAYCDPAGQVPLDYHYCSTIYRAQGATVDDAFLYLSPYMDRRLTYVALSRQREGIETFVGADVWEEEGVDPHRVSEGDHSELLATIAKRCAQPSQNDLAVDHLSAQQIADILDSGTSSVISLDPEHPYQRHEHDRIKQYISGHSPELAAALSARQQSFERTLSEEQYLIVLRQAVSSLASSLEI